MGNLDFLNLIFENFDLYLLALACCTIFYFYVGSKFSITWFDPMRIAMVTNVFMAAAFVFLYLTDIIEFKIFSFFLISELLFWLFFALAYYLPRPNFGQVIVGETRIAFWVFISFLVLFVLCTFVIYLLLGIPIFMESRLDTFTDSGGFGLLGRITPFFKIYCIFYIYYLLNNKPSLAIKILAYFSLTIFLVTGILSGSRSSFVVFITVFWGYSHFFKNDTSSFIKYYKYFGIFLIVTLFTFGFQSGDISLANSFNLFGSRMVLSGDNYMMALPNDIWKQITVNNWFLDFFYGLLGPARIISSEGIQPPIGFQLTWIIYPKLYGLSSGPLSSPSLLSWIYFGWGGLIFVSILGSFTGFLLYVVNHVLPKGIIGSALKTYLTINFVTFIYDPRLAMGYLFDTVVSIIILMSVCVLIFYSSNYGKIKTKQSS